MSVKGLKINTQLSGNKPMNKMNSVNVTEHALINTASTCDCNDDQPSAGLIVKEHLLIKYPKQAKSLKIDELQDKLYHDNSPPLGK